MALQELGSLVYTVLHCNIVAPSNAQATQEQVNIAVWGLTDFLPLRTTSPLSLEPAQS